MRATPTAEASIAQPYVRDYLDALRWEPDELTAQIEEMGEADGVPIVTNETWQFLHTVTLANRPQRVVEFGTAIGYSTLAIASALGEDALLTSFEIEPERHRQATDHMARAKELGLIRCDVSIVLGDALESMQDYDDAVDMAFLDATKGEYREYLELCVAHMEPGAIVLVDNALMNGAVALGHAAAQWSQESVEGQVAFNEAFVNDPRLTAMILPIGDGIAFGVRD